MSAEKKSDGEDIKLEDILKRFEGLRAAHHEVTNREVEDLVQTVGKPLASVFDVENDSVGEAIFKAVIATLRASVLRLVREREDEAVQIMLTVVFAWLSHYDLTFTGENEAMDSSIDELLRAHKVH